jgi:hypothetical protein
MVDFTSRNGSGYGSVTWVGRYVGLGVDCIARADKSNVVAVLGARVETLRRAKFADRKRSKS